MESKIKVQYIIHLYIVNTLHTTSLHERFSVTFTPENIKSIYNNYYHPSRYIFKPESPINYQL